MALDIEPGSPEWLRVISPSKVASICGVSRWQSAYSLWCVMKGWVEPGPTKQIFVVGHAFEYALSELWREENPGWRLSKGEVQYTTNSFAFPAVASIDRRASRGRARKIVEMKTARSLEDWGDPDLTGDCPADYALQVIAQQTFSGLTRTADLMVMGPFFKTRTYHIDWDHGISEWLVAECAKFYSSLGSDSPPELDDSVSTYRTVRAQHPDINPGEVVEVPEDLALAVLTTKEDMAKLDREHRGHKTRLLSLMGNAQHAAVNGVTIGTRGPHGRGGVALRLVGSVE